MIKCSIYFVRHGEKEASKTYNSIINKKLGLTKEGNSQSRSVGSYLKSLNIDHIYSSDYRRSIDTASIAFESRKDEIRIDERFGERILLTKDVDEATSKREFIRSQKDWSYSAEGGESIFEVVERFQDAIDAVLDNQPEGAAVFTHGRALQSYLSTVFTNREFDDHELMISPCDVYRVDYENGQPVGCFFVFSPFYDSQKGEAVKTLADTLVKRKSDVKKIEKTHLVGCLGHNIQANLYEKQSLDLLNSIGVKVPGNRVLVDRGKYVRMNFISGSTLGDLLSDSDQVVSYLKKLGVILRSFHNRVNGISSTINTLNINNPNPNLNAQCALNFAKLTVKSIDARSNGQNHEMFTKGIRLAEKVLHDNPDYLKSPDIIYGDFKPDNILIGRKDIYLIDPHLSYGRLSCDLGKMIARLYLTNPNTAVKNVAALLDGYKPDADMLLEIRHMAGMDILNTYSRLNVKNQLSNDMGIPSHQRTIQNMERCLMEVVPALFNSKDLIILRHLDDVQDFRAHYRNTPILDGEEKKVPEISHTILNAALLRGIKKVHFISSSQLRAADTAKLVAVGVAKNSPTIKTAITLDDRIRDLYHGRYVIPESYVSGSKLPALSIANKAYVEQTFNNRNIDYRNGDPLGGKYPALKGLFSEYGETQRSFSARFYDFMNSFLKKVDANPDTLFVVVAHTAIAFRLFEIKYLVKEVADKRSNIPVGELTFHEWRQAVRLDKNPGNQLFISPGEIKQVDLADLIGYSWRFVDEVRYLNNE